MKHKSSHTEHLTLDVMKLYLQGKLQNDQMFLVEKHLESCAFCSDAMEGLAISKETNELSIAELRYRLKNQKEEKKKREWYKAASVYGIAASAVLIIVSAIFIWIFNKNYFPDDKQTGSKNKEVEEPLATAPQAEDSLKLLTYSEKQSEEKPESRSVSRSDNKVSQQEEYKSEHEEEYKVAQKEEFVAQELSIDSQIVKVDKLQSIAYKAQEQVVTGASYDREPQAVFDDSGIQRSTLPERKSKKQSGKVASQPASAPVEYKMEAGNFVVRGRVLGEDGLPVPGVNVVEKGTAKGAVSDVNGFFEIPASKDAKLVISFIGFTTEEVAVKGRSDITVQLVPDVRALSEVVTIGYGTRSKKEVFDAASSKPEPVIGLKEYNKYIRNNLQYPKGEKAEGVVVIKFIVKADGSISDISIDKSLSPLLDEEAKRLLLEGSNWKPALVNNQPVDAETTLRIRFKKD